MTRRGWPTRTTPCVWERVRYVRDSHRESRCQLGAATATVHAHGTGWIARVTIGDAAPLTSRVFGVRSDAVAWAEQLLQAAQEPAA